MIGGKIRKAVLLCFLCAAVLRATPQDSLRTLPDSARWIGAEEVALALFAYITVPVWVSVGIASILSPTLLLEQTESGWRLGWSAGTGIGWSTQRQPLRFSTLRLQIERESLQRGSLSVSALFDWNAVPILLPEILRLGGSVGFGGEPLGNGWRSHLQAEVWLRNAMGVWYLGMFPQHSLGIRLRYRPWSATSRWQLALGYWSTFVW